MDLDKALVSAVLAEGLPALHKVRSRGLVLDLLDGEGKQAFEFVANYVEQYGQVPGRDLIEATTGVELNDPEGAAEFFVEEVFNRELFLRISKGLEAPLDLLKAREPRKAVDAIEELLHQLRQDRIIPSAVQSLFSLGPEVKSHYLRMKAGEMGLPFPWPKLNDDSLGMWPEDVILIAARTSVGKSWAALLCARAVWQAGYRVLFVTTEMSKLRIACRFAAIYITLPYTMFRKGQLTNFTEERFFKEIDTWASMQTDGSVTPLLDGIDLVGGDFDYRVESLSAAIAEARPDFVVLDGAYLLQVEGKDRYDKAANGFNELKRLARRFHIPILATTQFNRETKKNQASTAQLDTIALSDVGGWNASMVFALIQTDDMRKDKRMIVKTLKARESAGADVMIRWDLDLMDFQELDSEGGGGGDADEFGTALGTGPKAEHPAPEPAPESTEPF